MKNLKKSPKPWHIGTHLRVLSVSYPMNTNMTGFGCFQNWCVLVLWMKVASALEGLSFKYHEIQPLNFHMEQCPLYIHLFVLFSENCFFTLAGRLILSTVQTSITSLNFYGTILAFSPLASMLRYLLSSWRAPIPWRWQFHNRTVITNSLFPAA